MTSPARRGRGGTPAVLGIDLGTSEAKAVLLGLDGTALGVGRSGYGTARGDDGRAEQDPRDWWWAVTTAVRELETSVADVLAVCGVAQGPTLAVVDDAASPLRPAITWQDRRRSAAGFGLAPTIEWLLREEPEAVARGPWLLSAWDALGLWLTGVAATSLQPHEQPLDEAGFVTGAAKAGGGRRIPGARPPRLAPPRPYGSRLGSLRPDASAALGLRAGLPVVAGVNDGTASMLGAGLRGAGDAVDTGGTSGGIGVYVDAPLDLPGVFCAPAPLSGLWVAGGAMAATGAAVDWLRSTVLDDRWTSADLIAAADAVPAGSRGLVFLPYLAGERAPIFDEAARGAFVGLTLTHGAPHLARAVLEGGAFALRHVVEPIAAAGAPLREVWLAGRATEGDLWARIKADVLGVPVVIPAVADTAAVGAAIIAAVGVGAVASLEDGVEAMTSIARRLDPDGANRARYDELFAVYRGLYPALAPSFARLALVGW